MSRADPSCLRHTYVGSHVHAAVRLRQTKSIFLCTHLQHPKRHASSPQAKAGRAQIQRRSFGILCVLWCNGQALSSAKSMPAVASPPEKALRRENRWLWPQYQTTKSRYETSPSLCLAGGTAASPPCRTSRSRGMCLGAAAATAFPSTLHTAAGEESSGVRSMLGWRRRWEKGQRGLTWSFDR